MKSHKPILIVEDDVVDAMTALLAAGAYWLDDYTL